MALPVIIVSLDSNFTQVLSKDKYFLFMQLYTSTSLQFRSIEKSGTFLLLYVYSTAQVTIKPSDMMIWQIK